MKGVSIGAPAPWANAMVVEAVSEPLKINGEGSTKISQLLFFTKFFDCFCQLENGCRRIPLWVTFGGTVPYRRFCPFHGFDVVGGHFLIREFFIVFWKMFSQLLSNLILVAWLVVVLKMEDGP